MAPKRMLQGSSDVRRWWRHKVSKVDKPFFATAVTELRPEEVGNSIPGAHFSVVFDRGIRHYCFDNQADRDRFLTKYRKVFSAQAVGKDPCP